MEATVGLGRSVHANRELSCNWIRNAFASWTTVKLQHLRVLAWAKHVQRIRDESPRGAEGYHTREVRCSPHPKRGSTSRRQE